MSFEVDAHATDVARLRAHIVAEARNTPGVYLMRNALGDVLYVGKSTRLRSRLLSYFRLPYPQHRHARMLRETTHIEWEQTAGEFAALLREVRLIRTHLPPFNVRTARPLDRWYFITIAPGPAPRLRIQRASAVARARERLVVIGPFTQRRPLAEALRVLNDALGLRDCADHVPMVLRDGGDLFDYQQFPSLVRTPACHRYETKRCLGPCVAACSSGEYRVQLERARAVLEGRDDEPQQRLLQEMASASAALEFERAGWLRDRLAALESLEEQLERIRGSLVRTPFLYREGNRVYCICHGIVAGEADASDAAALAHLEAQVALSSTAWGLGANQLDEALTIAQWFRGNPGEPTGRTLAEIGVAPL